jgi:hypothetical protein
VFNFNPQPRTLAPSCLALAVSANLETPFTTALFFYLMNGKLGVKGCDCPVVVDSASFATLLLASYSSSPFFHSRYHRRCYIYDLKRPVSRNITPHPSITMPNKPNTKGNSTKRKLRLDEDPQDDIPATQHTPTEVDDLSATQPPPTDNDDTNPRPRKVPRKPSTKAAEAAANEAEARATRDQKKAKKADNTKKRKAGKEATATTKKATEKATQSQQGNPDTPTPPTTDEFARMEARAKAAEGSSASFFVSLAPDTLIF